MYRSTQTPYWDERHSATRYPGKVGREQWPYSAYAGERQQPAPFLILFWIPSLMPGHAAGRRRE